MTGLYTKEDAQNTDLDLVEALTKLDQSSPFASIDTENMQALRKPEGTFK